MGHITAQAIADRSALALFQLLRVTAISVIAFAFVCGIALAVAATLLVGVACVGSAWYTLHCSAGSAVVFGEESPSALYRLVCVFSFPWTCWTCVVYALGVTFVWATAIAGI